MVISILLNVILKSNMTLQLGFSIRFIIIIVFMLKDFSKAANYTFTYDMASECKEHTCKHGYSYDTFYSVISDVTKQTKDPNVLFEMHLAILAPSNGHILLSTIPHPEANDPVYEIVVGGGGNKFTEIRRNLRKNAKQSEKTLGILSSINFTPFYIRITEDGDVEFGKEGEDHKILSYSDVNPIPVNYFSFASWTGVEAKFLYDCPVYSNNGTEIKMTNSQKVERKLSNSEKIRQSLLNKYPEHMASDVVTVRLGLDFGSVKYNAYNFKLTTHLSIIISWKDENLIWDPEKYNGTASVMFRQGEIWRPRLFVFNSDAMSPLDVRSPAMISVVNSGEATFRYQSRVNSWCSDDMIDSAYRRWPRDEYMCSIAIGAWEAHERIYIIQDPRYQNQKILKDFSEKNGFHYQNEWAVVVSFSLFNHTDWNGYFGVTDTETYQSSRYLVHMDLKRRATTYDMAFYTPLLVLIMFVLMSFWTEPLQMSRLWFYCGAVVVMCLGLCYLDFLIPVHSTPSILITYTTVLFCVLQALIVQVLLMTSTVKQLCKTAYVQKMIMAKMIRVVFCLKPVKNCANYESINEAYSQEADDDTGANVMPRNGNIEEMEVDNTQYGGMDEIAEVIDKITFFVYSIVFIVMLSS